MRKATRTNTQLMGPEVQVCQHHWVIDRPNGPTSPGFCRNCGEQRDFLNYAEGSAWGSDVSFDHLSGGSRIPTRMDLGIGVGTGFSDTDDEG